MAQSRLTKEELRHDVVQDTLLEGVDYLQRHLKWVILAAVAAVVVAAIGIGVYAYLQSVAKKESAAYYAAEKLMAQPGASLDERIKQTEAAMETFVKENPRSSLAPAAYGYLGRIAFDRKEYDKADAAFQKALAVSSIDPVQKAATYLSLGKLREAQGKPQEALAFYNQIADKRFEDAKAYAIGTAELATGKADDARKQFQNAASGQPGTAISTWAKDALDYLP